MSKQKLIILRGYPGSGKTTVGKQLENRGLGKFIDHNAILTFVTKIAGNDDGIYDQIADLEIAICAKLISEGRTVIVARGFSKLSSLLPYEQIAKKAGLQSIIIRLNVSQKELANRVTAPARKLDFNPTINEHELRKWVTNNPLESKMGEIIIDNQKPLNKVLSEIKQAIS